MPWHPPSPPNKSGLARVCCYGTGWVLVLGEECTELKEQSIPLKLFLPQPWSFYIWSPITILINILRNHSGRGRSRNWPIDMLAFLFPTTFFLFFLFFILEGHKTAASLAGVNGVNTATPWCFLAVVLAGCLMSLQGGSGLWGWRRSLQCCPVKCKTHTYLREGAWELCLSGKAWE